MNRIDKLLALVRGDKLPDWAEAYNRERVADFIVDFRLLCADLGPWRYAADLGAPSNADLRTIAYLAVWHDGPRLQIWKHVEALDAIDLVIDAAAEGFAQYVAKETTSQT